MTKSAKINRWLLLFVMGVMLFPLVQESFLVFSELPLKGEFEKAKKPRAGLGPIWDGTFQDSFEIWHNENFGFRNTMVRFHNQLEFSLFEHTVVSKIVLGKNDQLFALSYISAYTGKDFIGEKSISEITRKIKLLQDSLEASNITLIIGLAPGKASFYPEYIPEELLTSSKLTNQKAFSKSFKKSGINLIDFNTWFLLEKEKTHFPLFPKTGVHWSRYGSLLATDSLISYIESKRQIDMPSVITTRVSWSDSPRSPDDDIGESMNLLFPITPQLMAYPEYSFENPEKKTKIKMITIADSYFWSMYDIRLAPQSFLTIDFWYYNKQVFHSDGKAMQNAMDTDACLETEKNDIVFILATETNLSEIGWGYIDDAYEYFVLKKKDRVMNKLIRLFETAIRADQSWMMNVKMKAGAKKISIDSMIHLDAIFMAKERINEKKIITR